MYIVLSSLLPSQDEDWKYDPVQRQEETLEENQAEVVDSLNLTALSLLETFFGCSLSRDPAEALFIWPISENVTCSIPLVRIKPTVLRSLLI